jgi:Tfp pilus assembly protein PilF
MAIGWREALAGAAVLFMVFLLVKLRPAIGRRGALAPEAQAAQAKALEAPNARARAEAFCEAGTLAAKHGRRWTVAANFFLRAMHADPTWPEAVTQMMAVLEKRRPKRLEAILWQRLAHTPWDEAHRAAAHAMVEALGKLYARQIGGSAKAEVMRKLAEQLSAGELQKLEGREPGPKAAT